MEKKKKHLLILNDDSETSDRKKNYYPRDRIRKLKRLKEKFSLI